MTLRKEYSLGVRRASAVPLLGLPTLSLGSLLQMETVMASTSQGAHEDLMR